MSTIEETATLTKLQKDFIEVAEANGFTVTIEEKYETLWVQAELRDREDTITEVRYTLNLGSRISASTGRIKHSAFFHRSTVLLPLHSETVQLKRLLHMVKTYGEIVRL